MPDITRVDLSQYRFRKAGEMLASAKRDMEAEDYASANNRAYKKYYARVMKGNMSREDFNAWAARAAAERDAAIEKAKEALDEDLKAQVVEELREKLNRQ